MKDIWKVLIIVILVGVLINLAISISQIERVKPNTEVRVLKLNNDNIIVSENIIDYVCTDGLKVSNIQSFGIKSFYASAWNDADVHKGICAIKIKNEV